MATTYSRQRDPRTAKQSLDLRGFVQALLSPVGLMAALVVLCFIFGGGSRADIVSLQWLRPLAVVLLFAGLSTLRASHVKAFAPVFLILSGIWLLTIIHLVPLPPSWWQALPGRELIANIDRLAGLEDQWRPLSLDPGATWNALWALVIPTAAIALAVQLDHREQRAVLTAILAMGALSIVVAAMQLAGGTQSGAYFYRITNRGAPPGLFSNRNHQAVFLASLFPLLAAWYGTRMRGDNRRPLMFGFDRHAIVALVAALSILPLILVTGSRAGLVATLIGVAGAAWIVGLPKRERSKKRSSKSKWSESMRFAPVAVAGLAGVLLVMLTLVMGRGFAVSRLFDDTLSSDLRAQFAPKLWDITQQYMPWGSGIGSIVKVFRADEPSTMLMPSYLNHAHNDYLEILLTAGVPGALLLLVGLGLLAYRGMRLFWTSRGEDRASKFALGKAGATIAVIMIMSSAADYPLRTPSLACLFALAMVWLWTKPYTDMRSSSERTD